MGVVVGGEGGALYIGIGHRVDGELLLVVARLVGDSACCVVEGDGGSWRKSQSNARSLVANGAETR